MGINKTQYKTLDRTAADKRVELCYEDSDGIWIDLAPGFNHEGCSGIRGDTVKHALEQMTMVKVGDPY